MFNCKDTARLVSEGLDRRLSLWQRLNLRLHLKMCGACSAYKRQIEALDRLFRSALGRSTPATSDGAEAPLGLSPQRREQIRQLVATESDDRHRA